MELWPSWSFNTERVMTQEEAQVLALACLTKRCPNTSCRIREHEVLVGAFGWVFSIEATAEDMPTVQGHHAPRLVLVNRKSRQVVATTRAHSAVSFAQVYETLLARSVADARNWCLTGDDLAGSRVDLPGIGGEARRQGLEDISG